MIERLIRNDLSLKRWRRFKRHRVAMVSLWLLLIISFFSFTAEFWSNSRPIVMKYNGAIYFPVLFEYHPSKFGREDILVMDYRALSFGQNDWAAWPLNQWDPYESNTTVESYPSGLTKMNWFGTDDRGRDVFARLLYGFRYTIFYAVGVWFLAYITGTLIGAAIGYFGGTLDLIGSRVVEIIEMMPTMLLLITLISIFSPSLIWLIIFTVLFDWTVIFHHMRAQFLQIRRREYIEAARAIGAGHSRIMLGHILPNALTPLVTFSPFAIAANISGLAILDYLGLGLEAPTPSWGELITQAQKYITTAEWLIWFPSLAIVFTMTALITIGLAIRDAYDARA